MSDNPLWLEVMRQLQEDIRRAILRTISILESNADKKSRLERALFSNAACGVAIMAVREMVNSEARALDMGILDVKYPHNPKHN